MTIHATAVAINGRAVLIRGKSGAGKSDVTLRLLALPCDALRAFGIPDCTISLIADDRVVIEHVEQTLFASAPQTLSRRLEVRGIGIVEVMATTAQAPVALIVDLVAPTDVPRMPDKTSITLNGLSIPLLKLAPFETTTPLKIALALETSKRHPSE
jgi:HPr kinase/phosphorylase